jgi:hypothetical protein
MTRGLTPAFVATIPHFGLEKPALVATIPHFGLATVAPHRVST